MFEYAGPIQTALRGWLGPGARLPDLRSGWGVALMMTLVYYPYVYTLARAALAEQAPEFLETARGLGRSRTAILFGVTLPLARPALAAGTVLACMEALADFGTVSTFSFRTLTEAIYRVWHGMFDRMAATQLAAILLGLAAGLLALERLSRGRARFTHGRRPARPPARLPLDGIRALGATAALRGHARPRLRAARRPAHRLGPRGARPGQRARRGSSAPSLQSLTLAAGAALLVTAVAVLLAYALRSRPTPLVTARDALRRPRVRLAGGGHRGRRPPPAGLARPRAGARASRP